MFVYLFSNFKTSVCVFQFLWSFQKTWTLIWVFLGVIIVDWFKCTFRDSSGVKPPSIGMTLTLFFGMTSRIEMSWVVTKTLAQTSKFLMILADHTSSKTSKLFLYWFRNNLRRISLACSTVVTDVTCKEIQNKFNFSMYMKKNKKLLDQILTSLHNISSWYRGFFWVVCCRVSNFGVQN